MNYKLAFALGLIPPGMGKPVLVGNYLTFTSPEPFTISTAPAYSGTSPVFYYMEYSTDTVNWNEWDSTETVLSSALHGGEYRVYVRGLGNPRTSMNYASRWRLSGKNIRCIGNIENLLDYRKVANGEHPKQGSMCFMDLFNGNSSLIEAPELPSLEAARNCYEVMFKGCPNLTKAPALPATIFSSGSCYQMFQNDTSLIAIPRLPATLSGSYSNCFDQMFSGCTSLKLSETQSEEYPTPYHIPAVEGSELWFSGMFEGTGGTFTGTPEPDTTYYLHKTNAVVG